MPEIPYFWFEAALLGFVTLVLLGIHLWRVIRSEVRFRKCVFCGESVACEDYTHHLEICGLKTMWTKPSPPGGLPDTNKQP
jgi:hypothetical protein